MAMRRMSVVIVGLVAFAVAGCAAADCAAKLAAIREFYASDSDCQGVVAVLDKETACTDSDKDLLGSCLKKKTIEWEDIIENCGMDTESESESEPEAPAAAPGDDDVMLGLSDSLEAGRKLLSTDASASCLATLYSKGLDAFDSSGAFSSGVSLTLMTLAGIIGVIVM